MKRPLAACVGCDWMILHRRTARETNAARTAARLHCRYTGHAVYFRCEEGRGQYRIVQGRVLFERWSAHRAAETRR